MTRIAPEVAQTASGVDAASGMIVAQTLTDQDGDDASQVARLLDQVDGRITRVTADGAYDGDPTYEMIAANGDGIEMVIPPRSTAVPSGELGSPTQRDRHLAMITEQGRLAWRAATNAANVRWSKRQWALQGASRPSATSPPFRGPADRGCHWRAGS
jgi:hypothetical protein